MDQLSKDYVVQVTITPLPPNNVPVIDATITATSSVMHCRGTLQGAAPSCPWLANFTRVVSINKPRSNWNFDKILDEFKYEHKEISHHRVFEELREFLPWLALLHFDSDDVPMTAPLHQTAAWHSEKNPLFEGLNC
ncbi:hypothetical protein ACH5RR_032470 [Cinchona calisaya]|uniref:Uncharacterized protein n=1 Tax=Cinchona calisaya TaxID=153742 RepID=A0ABD2YI75_9GENT